jgi:predicted chitinase
MLGRSEDLGHYSVHTLTTLLGYYINHPSEAHIDHGHAETIANKAYGPNAAKGIELGNINEGDGWLFRGRGMKQLTGRFNYHGFTESLKRILNYWKQCRMNYVQLFGSGLQRQTIIISIVMN